MDHTFEEYKCVCGVKYCKKCNKNCLMCNKETRSKVMFKKDFPRSSLVEMPAYIRYELRLGKFTLWVVFGKSEAIEKGVSERVYISLFYITKKKRYQKGFTLLK